jgi:hypothetical protein
MENVARKIMFTFPKNITVRHEWTIIMQGRNVVSTFTNCCNVAPVVFNNNTRLVT